MKKRLEANAPASASAKKTLASPSTPTSTNNGSSRSSSSEEEDTPKKSQPTKRNTRASTTGREEKKGHQPATKPAPGRTAGKGDFKSTLVISSGSETEEEGEGDNEDEDKEEEASTAPPLVEPAAKKKRSARGASKTSSVDEDEESGQEELLQASASKSTSSTKSAGIPSTQLPSKLHMRVLTSPTKALPTLRIQSSPTKKSSDGTITSGTKETFFVLGVSNTPIGKEATAVDRHGTITQIKVWTRDDKGQFTVEMIMQFVTATNLPKAKPSNYGTYRTVSSTTTVTKAEDKDRFDAGHLIYTQRPKPSAKVASPFIIYAELLSGGCESVPPKVPNFRGILRADGVTADVFGWMEADRAALLNQINKTHSSDKNPLFMLGLATITPSRQNDGFYEIKMGSSVVVGGKRFFKKALPSLHNPVMASQEANNDPLTAKDDSYPQMTIYKTIDEIQKQPEHKTLYVKACIVVKEAGSNLTVPICSEPDCFNQCGYDSDIGPFTCNNHGVVQPIVISRPTATVYLKTQDNRHEHTDKDITINCTIAKGQEAVYLGLTLESLLEDDIDVDKVRENLQGQRFQCTLAISKTSITAIRLQKAHSD